MKHCQAHRGRFGNISHFSHIDIMEPYDYIFGVCKGVVKVIVVDYHDGHDRIRGLFTFSKRTRIKCSPNGS